MRPIYLDHHATTPVDPRVLEAMLPFFTEDFGNPSSATHEYGWRAEAAVEDARERLAAAIGAGGLGVFIFQGLARVDTVTIMAGAVPAALMALALDGSLHLLERHLDWRRE